MVVATCSPVLAHALPPKWLGRAWGILGAGWGIGEVVALAGHAQRPDRRGVPGRLSHHRRPGPDPGRSGPLSESDPGATVSPRGGDHGPRPGLRAGVGRHQPQGASSEPHKRRRPGHRRRHPRVDAAVPPGHPWFARDHLAVSACRARGGAARRQSARRDRVRTVGEIRGHHLVDDPDGSGDGSGGLRAGRTPRVRHGAARRVLQHDLLPPDDQLLARSGGQALAGRTGHRPQYGAGLCGLDAVPVVLRPVARRGGQLAR